MELRHLGQSVIAAGKVRRSPQPPGFSLVELLVATSVILILLSLMLPALKRSIRQARTTVCMHNLRSLDQLLNLYANDNHGWLPYLDDVLYDPASKTRPPTWYDLLVPEYVDDLSFLICPEDPAAPFLHLVNPNRPAVKNERTASYGLSGFLLASPGGYLANDSHRPKRPQDTLLIADMGPDAGWRVDGSSGPTVPGAKWHQARLSWSDGFDPGATHPRYSWLTERHTTGINALTLGSSVRSIRTTEAMTRPIQSYYDECAAGDCVFCRELDVPHYSFYHARTYWWTGPLPAP
jgi:prepilin-type N-terminal cleavage/methylation domain-containing protein